MEILTKGFSPDPVMPGARHALQGRACQAMTPFTYKYNNCKTFLWRKKNASKYKVLIIVVNKKMIFKTHRT
jgi:hypothetical protein